MKVNLEMGAFGIDHSQFAVGDLILDPFGIAWHKKRFDAMFAFTIVAPMGKYDETSMANAGSGYWSFLPSYGMTFYLNKKKTLTAAFLARFDMHSKRKKVDVKYGSNFSIEWGLGKSTIVMPKKPGPPKAIWDVGVSGYCIWQLSDDSGADINWDPTVHDSVLAAGPEVGVFLPKSKCGFQLRWLFEFSAKDRPKGSTLVFSFMKEL
jgi:hypothetical protein